MNLSILIPSLNEYDNLCFLIPRIHKSLSNMDIKYEIIIIDSFKTDLKTKNLAKEYGLVHINRDNSNSYGDAVRSGIKNAKGEIVIFMDADGSHDPEEIKSLYEMANKSDLAISSRYLDKSFNEKPFFGSLFLNWLCNKFFNIECSDISNSFKAYKLKHLKALNVTSSNIDIIEEIVLSLNDEIQNFKILERPANFLGRKYGKSKREPMKFFISYIITLFRIKFFNKL